MEKKIIKKSIKRSILVILLLWFLGITAGMIMEKIWPVQASIQIISQKEIFTNNIGTLIRTVGFGSISIAMWCIPFLFSVGDIVGQSIIRILCSYGMNGMIKGFMPHAGIEMLSCFLAAFVPIFSWQIVLEAFIKKTEANRKIIILRSVAIVIICIILMLVCSYSAAYIEYNISEQFWKHI